MNLIKTINKKLIINMIYSNNQFLKIDYNILYLLIFKMNY